MKRHYRLRSVSCNTCHLKEVKEKSRDELTDFGKVIGKLVEGQQITERLDAVEDADKEEKDKVEDAIEEEFVETLKKLDAMKAPGGKTYGEAITGGEIEGIKPRK